MAFIASGRLEDRVRAYAAERTPALDEGQAVLAVSGGADSIATAALLCDSGVIDRNRSIVAHFDHRLRDLVAAARDRLAVETLCGSLGLALETGAWEHPRRGEAHARAARYAFLSDVASRAGIDTVVTGHTSDDQVETVLMHAMRGAGLHGLSGIAAQAVRDGVTIARPMLCASRVETRAYCEARGLTFVDDETNSDTTLVRNRVRLQLLPALESSHPSIKDTLMKLAERSRELARAMDAAVRPAITATGDGRIVLSRGRLSELPAEARSYAFRLALTNLLGEARDIDRRHYTRLPDPVKARAGSVYELPRGVRVVVGAESFEVRAIDAAESPVIEEGFTAALPFVGVIGAWHVRLMQSNPGEANLHVPKGSVLRRRQAGDRLRLRGGTRKLQDVLIDAKVPRGERDGMPVLANGSEVVWTPVAQVAGCEGIPYQVEATRTGSILTSQGSVDSIHSG